MQQHVQLAGGCYKAGALLASAFTLSISASNATSRSIRLGKNRERKKEKDLVPNKGDTQILRKKRGGWRFLGLPASERRPTEGSRSPPPARLCSGGRAVLRALLAQNLLWVSAGHGAAFPRTSWVRGHLTSGKVTSRLARAEGTAAVPLAQPRSAGLQRSQARAQLLEGLVV